MSTPFDAAVDIIEYIRGASTPIWIEVEDDVDFTGALDAWVMLKATLGDADSAALVSKRLGSGVDLISATKVGINLTPTDSAALTAGVSYCGELVVKTAAGQLVRNTFFLRAVERIVQSAA